MCFWATHFYTTCSHSPLYLQDLCSRCTLSPHTAHACSTFMLQPPLTIADLCPDCRPPDPPAPAHHRALTSPAPSPHRRLPSSRAASELGHHDEPFDYHLHQKRQYMALREGWMRKGSEGEGWVQRKMGKGPEGERRYAGVALGEVAPRPEREVRFEGFVWEAAQAAQKGGGRE